MQRRKFIANLVWIGGGILGGGLRTLASPKQPVPKKLIGYVKADGKGIANVVVSNGFETTITNKAGKYELRSAPGAQFIFISTPAGYAFPEENGIARHYRVINELNLKKDINFHLHELPVSDDEHQFIIWADPQVKNKKDVERMMQESVPDVQQFAKAAGTGALIHGISVGDIVWDNHDLFHDYNVAVEKMGIPFFQCLGNHDMDYNKGDDSVSDDTFQRLYGPTYYSFNRGKVHYVVLDDVRYLGKEREYDGYISEQQLDWLKKDLSYVPAGHLVIVCLHIPVHDGVKNNQQLYDILGKRNVHIMSGHTHYNKNVITKNIYEHNHGTVCGAWWTGPICGDGTPSGYGVYKVKGTELSWYYKGSGEADNHQLNLFIESNESEKQLIANVWNYDSDWKVEYWINDEYRGLLPQQAGFDPLSVKLYKGPELPKPRSSTEPKKTDHLFMAMLTADARSVKVQATDRFGIKYSSIHHI